MAKWEYMTWRVGSLGREGADVRVVNGEEFKNEERPPFYEALSRAGADGWELVGFDGNYGALIFKRPKEES